MVTKLIDLIESVNADDLPTNMFTIEDKDPMVILGKLNEVIAYLETLQATINASDSKANEALQRAIQAVADATQSLSTANGADTKADTAIITANEAKATANDTMSLVIDINTIELPAINERLDKIEDNTQKNVDQIYNILGQTVIYPLENTSKYSLRATADGSSDIIDGAYARIDKIQGSSVPYGEETTIGLTQFLTGNFYGIKSTGRNLLPYPYTDTTQTNLGITYTDNGDGSITIKGTATGFSNFKLYIAPNNNSAGNFNFIDGKTYKLSPRLIVYYKDENGDAKTNGASITWKTGYTLLQIYIQIYPDTTVDTVVTPMINIGSTALPYEPYKTFEMNFNVNYELKEYDYIDLENKQIVEQSGYLEQAEPFTENQLANYTEYVLSKDGKAIVYKTENKTINPLSLEGSFEYLAFANGSEMVLKQPELNIPTTDCTITTTYIAKKGVTK